MRAFFRSYVRLTAGTAALAFGLLAQPAMAQDASPPAKAVDDAKPADASGAPPAKDSGGGTDILSADTLTFIAQANLALADGHTSFADGGFGKTRFHGSSSGDFQLQLVPTEAALIWQPRFTSSLSGNVSVAWQNDQENPVDVLEGYLTFNPSSHGKVRFSGKGGLYWPEISLEHSTGGAWSTVYTLTPSVINAWVGEEVKVIGAEATIGASLGSQELSLTGAAFGFNDTSGTLLSFRGWAAHDLKATAFGHFALPPRNAFMTFAQAPETRSLYEIDGRVGFYGRAEWRPAQPVVLSVFYYDNRGDPAAVVPSLQWGWRTRFWNVGLIADLGGNTRFIAQGMTGTTQMGFKVNNVTWVDTHFSSVFGLLTHPIGRGAVSGRLEWFDTREHGSEMNPAEEDEDGWAATLAARWPVWKLVTLWVEGLHIESDRGARARLALPPKEDQNVLQAALRLRW